PITQICPVTLSIINNCADTAPFKVDTETSAMIKYDVRLDSGTSARLSEISKYTEQVVERGGCPLSFTEITRFCFMLSDSAISRCALISPVWRPMVKINLSGYPNCSSYLINRKQL
uniref:Uncharacterized protein n=1 Tax=Astyanax mexicanus TaxID=7994 RepID=A0A3B1KFF4_ASTMX